MSAVHFESEKASLEERMRDWDQGLRDAYVDDVVVNLIAEKKNGLQAVNAILWQAEDEVRITPELEALKLAQLCKRIARMNDERARLVRKLDSLYGLDEGPEKLYPQQNYVNDIEL